MNVRVPPCSAETERAVLCTVLEVPDTLPEIRTVVRSEHFANDFVRRCFGVIEWLDDQREPVDITAMCRRLKDTNQWRRGDSETLAEILAVPVISQPEKHARQIAELARLRRVISESQRIAAEGYEASADPRAFVDAAEAAMFAIAADNIRADRLVPARDAVAEALEELAVAARSGVDGVTGCPSGFSSVDSRTTGMHRGDLYIVAARPGMGKTSYALGAALNAAESGRGVAFFSLEMPRAQLAMRLLAVKARVDVSRLRSANMRPDDWDRMTQASMDIAKLPIDLDDTPALTLLELRAKIRRLQAQHRARNTDLGLVVIDYLQLMRGRAGVQSREQEVSELSRGLKELAKEFGVPVVALSQLNRSVETRSAKDKRPQLSDLRESGAIEQDADAIFFLYRDEYYFKDSPDQGIAEVIIAKQRNGPTGTCKLRFQSEFTRFDNLAPHEYEMNEYDDFDNYDQPADAAE